MLEAKQKLLTTIGQRRVYIWGARMTGLGFKRFCDGHGISVAGFVDSDPAFVGSTISGVDVLTLENIATIDKSGCCIVIAVSIKEAEIVQCAKGMGFSDENLLCYSDYCSVFYTIDVVGTCNLKCPSCAHSMEDIAISRGTMPFADFKAVTDKILAENAITTHVSLYSWGEPFLHPQLPDIVEYLHGKNIAVALSSNLSLPDSNRIRDVIRKSPDYLKVSTSGYYPDAYNSTHTGGDTNLVKSNLYKLRYYLDKYNASTVVDVNYHLYNNNNGNNLQKYRELCDELGFILSTTYALVMPLERVIKYCQGRPEKDTLALHDYLLVGIDEGIRASNQIQLIGCPFRDNQTNISWDLSVPVCCTVFERDNQLLTSNFLETPRQQIEENKKNIALCSQCMSYGLPAYNMGFNRKGWDVIAQGKESDDNR
ncbi:radical SAM protein [Methylomonas sp. YC3]